MSVLVNENTYLIIQGITGNGGRVHAKRILNYGGHLVGGVTPGKGGQKVEGLPVYNTVAEAVAEHPEINATLILTPAGHIREAGLEAVEAGIELIVLLAEWTPVQDSLDVITAARKKGLKVVGPNTIGVISPGKGIVGIMPGNIYGRGHIGLISRSGTLTHENSSNLTYAGYGLSTCIGIGGDPIIGMNHTEALELFREDEDTKLIVMIGEIGGGSEEAAAEYITRTGYPKPIVSLIAGTQAPEGKNMGHAGAIVSGNTGTAKSKIARLSEAGVRIAYTPGQVVELVREEDEKLGGILRTLEPAVRPD